MSAIKISLQGKGQAKTDAESDAVDLNSLSDLTGFPVEFIRKELILDEGPVSMDQLRSSMLQFLDATLGPSSATP